MPYKAVPGQTFYTLIMIYEIIIEKSIHLNYISQDLNFFSLCNTKMSNLTNKRNAIKVLNVYQVLADITEQELNVVMFLLCF